MDAVLSRVLKQLEQVARLQNHIRGDLEDIAESQRSTLLAITEITKELCSKIGTHSPSHSTVTKAMTRSRELPGGWGASCCTHVQSNVAGDLDAIIEVGSSDYRVAQPRVVGEKVGSLLPWLVGDPAVSLNSLGGTRPDTRTQANSEQPDKHLAFDSICNPSTVISNHCESDESSEENEVHALPPAWPACIKSRASDAEGPKQSSFESEAIAKSLTLRLAKNLHPQNGSRRLSRSSFSRKKRDSSTASVEREERVSDSLHSKILFLEEMSEIETSHTCFVLHPGSRKRVGLDLLSVVVLSYDLVATPFFLAWDINASSSSFSSLNWFSTIFWTVDIMFQFRTGFYEHGNLQLRNRAIALRYLRTWFFLDITIVTGDWAALLITMLAVNISNFNSSRILRLFKVSRLLRLVGLLRVARITDQCRRISNRIVSEALRNMVHIMLLLVFIFWLNHVVGCVWYAIGVCGVTDTGASWVETPIVNGDYQDLGILFQYTTALHWSITQMTPGSIPLQPLNSLERVWNIVCLVLGVLFFSSIISSLSAQMTQLKMVGQERQQLVSTLDRFLQENHISGSLGVSVKRQVEERMLQRKPLALADVAATELLSDSLFKQLRTELCKGHLLRGHFFRLVYQVDSRVFQDARKVCRIQQRDLLNRGRSP